MPAKSKFSYSSSSQSSSFFLAVGASMIKSMFLISKNAYIERGMYMQSKFSKLEGYTILMSDILKLGDILLSSKEGGIFPWLR